MLYRFNLYQMERCPFIILLFTTLSVVLSSAAIVLVEGTRLSDMTYGIIIGTITCLFFMFSIRVFDDSKDKGFDDLFHLKRPVQRGLISMRELNIVNIGLLFFQAIINIVYSLQSFLYWIVAMAYSLLARSEFFMSEVIRKKFIFYNALNMMQIFFLQIYLYKLLNPSFSFSSMIFMHAIFVLSNAIILEIARKLKSVKDESSGKDTYSGRYGYKIASLMFTVSYIFTYILFINIILALGYSLFVFILGFALLSIIGLSTIYYYKERSKISSYILQACARLFYIGTHLLIAWSAFS